MRYADETKVARRGGAPVGFITELRPVEAGAVLYLRRWCDGPGSQSLVQKDFRHILGHRVAPQAL